MSHFTVCITYQPPLILTAEIQCIWNVKTKVIPVIIGATGTNAKSFIKYLSNIL